MRKYIYVLLGFIVPGLPYLLAKEYKRYAMIFPLLYLTFAIGLLLNGAVVMPKAYQSPVFNILAYLGYVSQMFFGLPAWMNNAWVTHQMEIEMIEKLPSYTSAEYFDLGSYFLVVAGGLNYYANVKLFDFVLNKKEDASG